MLNILMKSFVIYQSHIQIKILVSTVANIWYSTHTKNKV